MLSDDLHNINKKANDENVQLNLDYRYNDPTSLVFELQIYRKSVLLNQSL